MKKKLCQECHAMLFGRSDKKFCDTYCKTAFHNKYNRSHHEKIKHINDLLKKNRQILKILVEAGITETPRLTLLNAGFHFQFFTHQLTDAHKFNVHYCYEYGYAETSADQIRILSDIHTENDFREKLKISSN